MECYCNGCYVEFPTKVGKCNTLYCKGTIRVYAEVENEEYTVKPIELECPVCDRVFGGNGNKLTYCNNKNCGVRVKD